MRYGVVAGKFWPFHNGHDYLLNVAAENCDFLDIILVARDLQQPSAMERALAIYESMQGYRVKVHIVGDIRTDDDTEESSQVWARYTPEILGHTPDVVFSSEEYGVRWAGYMGAVHVMVDLQRARHPVSGTEIRNNPTEFSDLLPPASKALILPRVVVMGAESTGTTTLANELGFEFLSPVVPEYGRILAEDYKAEHGVAPPLDYWDDQVFRLIAHGQNALEERYARAANKVLICDTDSLATAVWYERYHGRGSTEIDMVGLKQSQKHDLYIITSPEGVPWEDDGTRDGPDQRTWMHSTFLYMARRAKHFNAGVEVLEVKGTRSERLLQAREAVQRVLDTRRVPVLG